ncbi:hypothetical protein NCC49_002258 [Naganishia albida]|nr:hypothetical protein NCC49_002258 [Naganishia albida]
MVASSSASSSLLHGRVEDDTLVVSLDGPNGTFERDHDDDREPWQITKRRQGKASVTSGVSNLANTIIGSGALAFPSAFASMGLIPGVFSCAFSGMTSAFGLYLLSRCARQVGRPSHYKTITVEGRDPHGKDVDETSPLPPSMADIEHEANPGHDSHLNEQEASFNSVALLTFGQGWATRCFDAAIAIKCFGVSISYLIIVKTLMPQIIISFSHHLPHDTISADSMWLDGRLWLLLSFVVVGPISFLKRLDSLRFTSQIALASVAYLVVIVVGWWAFGVPTGRERGPIELARFDRTTLSVFPVQVFAYTCAQNLFPVFNELEKNTQSRMNKVIGTSIFSAVATYEVIGITGYLTFGKGVSSNVISMYPYTSLLISVAQLGIVLLVALSYPLQCHPCRACLHHLTTGWTASTHQALPTNEVAVSDDETASDDEDADGPAKPVATWVNSAEMSRAKFIGLTAGIMGCGIVIAMLIDELETVLAFVGSTGSTMISFILPGLFYFSLFRSQPNKMKYGALGLATYGVCVMVFW